MIRRFQKECVLLKDLLDVILGHNCNTIKDISCAAVLEPCTGYTPAVSKSVGQVLCEFNFVPTQFGLLPRFVVPQWITQAITICNFSSCVVHGRTSHSLLSTLTNTNFRFSANHIRFAQVFRAYTMKRTVLLLAVARVALSTPVPQQAPSGIGTGVTIAIAPPGGAPSGCAVAWKGAPFGIAAANITTGRRADVDTEAEPFGAASSLEGSSGSEDGYYPEEYSQEGYSQEGYSPDEYGPDESYGAAAPAPLGAGSPARATPAKPTAARATSAKPTAARATPAAAAAAPEAEAEPDMAGMPGMPMGDLATMIDEVDMPEMTPAPGQNKMVSGIARAGADAEPDSTITVRSTRTHTRTVTVKSNTPAPPPPMATELPPSDLQGKPSIKLGIIYQIEDGQIQAPEKHTPVQISIAQPAPGPGATATPSKPKAPSTAGSGPSRSGAGYPPSGPSSGSGYPPESGSGYPPESGSGYPPESGSGYPPGSGSGYPPGSGSGYPPGSGSGYPPGSGPGSGPSPSSGGKKPKTPTGAAPPERPRVSQISDGQVQAQIFKRQLSGTEVLVGCKKPDTLTLTLVGGVLKDNKGRTGYIASNRQFQCAYILQSLRRNS